MMLLALFLALVVPAGAYEANGGSTQRLVQTAFAADKTFIAGGTPTNTTVFTPSSTPTRTATPTMTSTVTLTPTFTALPTEIACGSTHKYAIFGASFSNSNDCSPVPTDGWQAAMMAARNPAYGMYYVGYLTISPTQMDCPYNNGEGGTTSSQVLSVVQTQLPTMVKTPSSNDRIIFFSSEVNDVFHGGNQSTMTTGLENQISAVVAVDSLATIVIIKFPTDNPIFTTQQLTWARAADDAAYSWAQGLGYHVVLVDSDGCVDPAMYCTSGALGHYVAAGWRQMGGCLAARFQAQGL